MIPKTLAQTDHNLTFALIAAAAKIRAFPVVRSCNTAYIPRNAVLRVVSEVKNDVFPSTPSQPARADSPRA